MFRVRAEFSYGKLIECKQGCRVDCGAIGRVKE